MKRLEFSCLKGTVTRDFRLQIFVMNQAPEYPNRAVSNFPENSRIYSQPMVHHRVIGTGGKRKKNFKKKSLNILFGHFWVVELIYR
jgi:hypothetical protein